MYSATNKFPGSTRMFGYLWIAKSVESQAWIQQAKTDWTEHYP